MQIKYKVKYKDTSTDRTHMPQYMPLHSNTGLIINRSERGSTAP